MVASMSEGWLSARLLAEALLSNSLHSWMWPCAVWAAALHGRGTFSLNRPRVLLPACFSCISRPALE